MPSDNWLIYDVLRDVAKELKGIGETLKSIDRKLSAEEARKKVRYDEK